RGQMATRKLAPPSRWRSRTQAQLLMGASRTSPPSVLPRRTRSYRPSGLCGCCPLARIRVQAVELIDVDPAHRPRGEQALEESADPPGAFPGGGDPYPRAVALGSHRERGDEARGRVGFG